MLSLYIIREQKTFFKIGFQQRNTTVLKEQIVIRVNNFTANNDNDKNGNLIKIGNINLRD